MIPDFSVGPFILMYHSIDDQPGDDPYSVSVTAFREQISWLSENGFEIISLSSLHTSIQSGNREGLQKKIVITFDDGCADFIANALPILSEYGAPATVFLVTGRLGERSSWSVASSNVSLMTEDEVRHIKSRGISLGSHTASHAKLTLLDHDELCRQLIESRDTLIRLGESFLSFSYPWGQWTQEIADTVKACGYECAVAVGEQTRLRSADIYFLPRVAMGRAMDLKRFQALMGRSRIEMALRWRYRTLRGARSGVSANS